MWLRLSLPGRSIALHSMASSGSYIVCMRDYYQVGLYVHSVMEPTAGGLPVLLMVCIVCCTQKHCVGFAVGHRQAHVPITPIVPYVLHLCVGFHMPLRCSVSLMCTYGCMPWGLMLGFAGVLYVCVNNQASCKLQHLAGMKHCVRGFARICLSAGCSDYFDCCITWITSTCIPFNCCSHHKCMPSLVF
jgi:hypothetical protein